MRSLVLVVSLLGCNRTLQVLIPPEGEDIAYTDVALTGGWMHACAVVGDALACWGNNTAGELGLGDALEREVAEIVIPSGVAAASAAWSHTCALHTDGSISCFGSNEWGQLGVGDRISRITPTRVLSDRTFTRVTTNYWHTCAIETDGTLWCWGKSEEGQLGGPEGSASDLPVQVGAESDWIDISAAQGHTCGIRAPGTIWCWGRNSDGHCGIGDCAIRRVVGPTQIGTDRDWATVASFQNTTCAIKQDGRLFCWGRTDFVGDPVANCAPVPVGDRSDWVDVQGNVFGLCARSTANDLYCSGRNVEGQLGLGDNEDRSELTRVGVDDDWSSLAVGRFFTCAEKIDHSVYCTGENDRGQLGLGDRARRNVLTAF